MFRDIFASPWHYYLQAEEHTWVWMCASERQCYAGELLLYYLLYNTEIRFSKNKNQ